MVRQEQQEEQKRRLGGVLRPCVFLLFKVCLCSEKPFGAAACVLFAYGGVDVPGRGCLETTLELATSSLSDGWMRTNHTFLSHR